jgi:teichuronic acid biosynthesis glycosyltransferase TuaC
LEILPAFFLGYLFSIQNIPNKKSEIISVLKILVISKRQYTNKDLIDDRYGRLREIPLELSRKGFQVNGLCLSYARKPEGNFWDEGVLWQSNNASTLILPGVLKYIYAANKIARKADLIWACSDSIYGIIGLIIARRHNIPLVFDLYDNFEYFLLGRLPLFKQLYHWSIRNCAAVTCVSNSLANRVASIKTGSGIVVIENAVRTDIFRPMDKLLCRRQLGLPEQGTLIGTAGAIHSNRGIDSLFKSFDRLKKNRPDLHLVLAGRWDRSIPHLKGSRIHYLGDLPLERVPLVINSLDVAVICNLDNEFGRYCFPQKAYEILACQVPIVAARVGSMAELFCDAPQRLFQPRNVDSMIKSIVFSLQTNHRVLFRPQTWKDAADKMETVAKMVVNNKLDIEL